MSMINGTRLYDHLTQLGRIGFVPKEGTTRLPYTPAYDEGRIYVQQCMEQAGLQTSVDPVGNLIGTLPAVWELDVKYAGLTRREKLAMVRGKMKEMEASVFVIPSLDEVAWLLNLRGNDVLFTPVFLSYLLLEQDTATLCVQREAVSAEIEAHLKSDGVTLAPYDDIYRLVAALPTGTRVLLDGERANYRILQSVPRALKTSVSPARASPGASPWTLTRAVST